ncbi:hypothetical protein D3C81_1969530 [compost metagenome]
MSFFDGQSIHEPLDRTGIQQATLDIGNDFVRFIETRTIKQDHSETSIGQWLDILVVVAPSTGTWATTMQHDHCFALPRLVVMKAKIT